MRSFNKLFVFLFPTPGIFLFSLVPPLVCEYSRFTFDSPYWVNGEWGGGGVQRKRKGKGLCQLLLGLYWYCAVCNCFHLEEIVGQL